MVGIKTHIHILALQMELYCAWQSKIFSNYLFGNHERNFLSGICSSTFPDIFKKRINLVIFSIQRFYATSQRHLLLLVKKKTLHTEIDALGFRLIREMEMSSKETQSQKTLKVGAGAFICITL